MRNTFSVLLVAGLGLGVAPASAQVGGAPPGGMTDMTPEQAEAMAERMMRQMAGQMGLDPEALRNATPEEREQMLQGGADAMAERMLLQMGARMGVDPDALRNASPEERERMIGAAAEAMAEQVTKQVEQTLDMSTEEMKNLSEEEIHARMAARLEPDAGIPAAIEPRPLLPAPRRGFPDGSVPLPVGENFGAELVFDEPPARDLLLVVADLRAREIVWRGNRSAPLREHLNLLEIAPDPSVLVIELIDPITRRVIRRYRPVAAFTE